MDQGTFWALFSRVSTTATSQDRFYLSRIEQEVEYVQSTGRCYGLRCIRNVNSTQGRQPSRPLPLYDKLKVEQDLNPRDMHFGPPQRRSSPLFNLWDMSHNMPL
ncbi:hypothetical protein AAP_00266 [Ascosphaera apis ARSEF 7405]|uniref:Uncharacterized protein n=1 Tax=Ascosphaera apis ARSEF 7405 TaxID=392613 RepID=A0A168DQN0_9EURO|nr:hypothetical protein AAP_00266 [Ascosphaera apis ARSEF 7405]